MHEILAIRKETHQKLRWDATVADAPFEFYIPKWRVPDIVPNRIRVRIIIEREAQSRTTSVTPKDVDADSGAKNRNIHSRVKYVREHTKTVRYDPIGDKRDWEIGSPYVPKSILPDKFPSILHIDVEWV